MNVEVDEDGGDWLSLVYDSGDVTSGNSDSVSGLSNNTTYQMRVRHSNYNDDTTTETWSSYSTVVDFTTGPPDAVEPSLGMDDGGDVTVDDGGVLDIR
jgi:hypothetical protein